MRAVDSDRGLPLTAAEVPSVAIAEPPEWLELHALIAMTPRSAHTDISRLTPARRVIDAAGSTLHIVPSWVCRVTAHRHVSESAGTPVTLILTPLCTRPVPGSVAGDRHDNAGGSAVDLSGVELDEAVVAERASEAELLVLIDLAGGDCD